MHVHVMHIFFNQTHFLIVKYDYEAKENKLDVQSHVTAFLVQNTQFYFIFGESILSFANFSVFVEVVPPYLKICNYNQKVTNILSSKS